MNYSIGPLIITEWLSVFGFVISIIALTLSYLRLRVVREANAKTDPYVVATASRSSGIAYIKISLPDELRGRYKIISIRALKPGSLRMQIPSRVRDGRGGHRSEIATEAWAKKLEMPLGVGQREFAVSLRDEAVLTFTVQIKSEASQKKLSMDCSVRSLGYSG